tara:strand:- start:275 stop:769 length:495 start_codon:yes stop_codon:yes gene_type:complete
MSIKRHTNRKKIDVSLLIICNNPTIQQTQKQKQNQLKKQMVRDKKDIKKIQKKIQKKMESLKATSIELEKTIRLYQRKVTKTSKLILAMQKEYEESIKEHVNCDTRDSGDDQNVVRAKEVDKHIIGVNSSTQTGLSDVQSVRHSLIDDGYVRRRYLRRRPIIVI